MESLHQVFLNDPDYLYSCIQKYVTVISGSKNYSGWLYTVDPVSESYVLVKFDDDESLENPEIIIVPGYSMTNISVEDKYAPAHIILALEKIFKREEINYSNESLQKKREALCLWLGENRVPYVVKNDLSIEVLQVASILPPYEADCIQCTNEVILDKVMKLVNEVPSKVVSQD